MKCPNCDSENLHKNMRCKFSMRPTRHFFICRDCGILFESVDLLNDELDKKSQEFLREVSKENA